MEQYYNYQKRCNEELARAYVPFQRMNQIYSPAEALKKGTLFPELYKPYKSMGKQEIGGIYYEQ